MGDEFETNLLRFLVSQQQLLCEMQIAREMFGKGYFELGVGEKLAVDQTVIGALNARFGAITPEWLASQTARQPAALRPPSEVAAVKRPKH